MTQPRKEQVKNLKTKYFRGPVTVGFGGTSLQNVTGADLATVLASSRTGLYDGAEVSSEAVLTGGQGPFILAFNTSFTIIMAGVNSGLPITITFVQADFIKLNGGDVMTTSRTAAKINSVLAGFGVTVPVAVNVEGRLILRSANASGFTYGDMAYISLADVTPGTLQTLGFSVTNQASANGVTAPKRGIVTSSRDGLGGIIQIRNLDATPSEPKNPSMIQVAPYKYVPEVLPGRPAYARVRQIPVGTPGLEITYFRTGPIRPSVVTSLANLSDLETTDQLDVSVNFGNGTTVSFSMNLEDVATVAQVVDAVNAKYRDSTAALTLSTEFTRAAVPFAIPGPYVFTDPAKRDSFFVSFNGNTPIHINPPAGEYSASGLATYINTRIASASQAAEGEAVALSINASPDPARVVIRSKNLNGQQSSVAFLPGSPGATLPVPGQFLETLDALGVTPGLYRGTYCAQAYGADEIEFFCPSSLPGASITLTPSSTLSGSRWGIPAAVTQSTSVGQVKVSVPPASVILPEMVEFHEEPDTYDTEIQDFDNRGDAAELDPAEGIGNIGLSALLGDTGKIDPSFIPRILESLTLGRLNLGQDLVKSATDQRSPRQTFPFNPANGPVLLWQGVDVTEPTSAGLTRMYLNQGDLYVTRNAKVNAAGNWERDVANVDSSLFEVSTGRTGFGVWPAASAVPWSHTSWQRSVTVNPFAAASGVYREGLVSIGEFQNTGVQANVPRVELPIQLQLPTLLFTAKGPSGAKIRAYSSVDNFASSKSWIEITVNASFNGTQYSKDVTGALATRYRFSTTTGFTMSTRKAANDTAWSSWDSAVIRTDPASLQTTLGGPLLLGDELLDGSTPRITAQRFSPNTTRRTLLFESPIAGSATSVPIRIYIDTSNTNNGEGFTFTWNAKWDNSIARWVQDTPSQRAYAWAMSPGKFWFFSKAAGSLPWDDGYFSWDSYDAFDRAQAAGSAAAGMTVKDGTYRVDSPGAVSNPAATAPVLLNAVYAKSMVKAWGIANYGTSGGGVVDGFNFSSINTNSLWWDSWYATNIGGPTNGYAVMCQILDGNGSGGQLFWCTAKPNILLSSRFIVGILNFQGTLVSQSTTVPVMHVVFKGT